MATLMIQGPPRSGKTTLVQYLVKHIQSPMYGFYTEEVRDRGNRIGFDVIDLKTKKLIPLARKSWNFHQSVASYGVDVDGFSEYISKIATEDETGQDVIIIDEIGKMEMLSKNFLDWVETQVSNNNVIATIPSNPPFKLQKFLEDHKHDKVTIRSNIREKATEEALKWLKEHEISLEN